VSHGNVFTEVRLKDQGRCGSGFARILVDAPVHPVESETTLESIGLAGEGGLTHSDGTDSLCIPSMGNHKSLQMNGIFDGFHIKAVLSHSLCVTAITCWGKG
jgi:hypothetical protein